MNKRIIAISVSIVLLVLGGIYYYRVNSDTPVMENTVTKVIEPKDMIFEVEGNEAKYFGDESEGDLDGDAVADKAFLITYDGGGSGTFYYAIVALKTKDGYKLTNPILIGDRIAPQSTYIPVNSEELQVNYADRKPGEPMSTAPSEGKTLLLKVTPAGTLESLMK